MNSKLPSNRSFGLTFSIIFFIIAFFVNNNFFLVVSLFFSLALLCIVIFKQDMLTLPNLYWSKLGLILSMIFNPLIMLIIYFFLFVPLSIFYRFKKNKSYILNYKDKSSNWIKRIHKIESMDSQF